MLLVPQQPASDFCVLLHIGQLRPIRRVSCTENLLWITAGRETEHYRQLSGGCEARNNDREARALHLLPGSAPTPAKIAKASGSSRAPHQRAPSQPGGRASYPAETKRSAGPRNEKAGNDGRPLARQGNQPAARRPSVIFTTLSTIPLQ